MRRASNTVPAADAAVTSSSCTWTAQRSASARAGALWAPHRTLSVWPLPVLSMGSSSRDGRSGAFVVEEGPALRQLVALALAYMRRNELLRAGFSFGLSSLGELRAAPIQASSSVAAASAERAAAAPAAVVDGGRSNAAMLSAQELQECSRPGRSKSPSLLASGM